MRVFLSWSGERSMRIAEALKDWLPNVHQQIEIFFSPNDIEKGAKWTNEIEAQLRDTQYCLVCLTAEALQSAWINFESGAISKGIGQNRVTPVLFDLPKSEVSGPLALFQLADFKEEEMRQVLKSINLSFENRLSDEVLKRAFDRWWPDLESEVASILKDSPSKKPPQKSQRELSEEILLNTRELIKQIGRGSGRNSRALTLITQINRVVTRLHESSVSESSEESSEMILFHVHKLGKKLNDLNVALGKVSGASLIQLRAWLQATAENDRGTSDAELSFDTIKAAEKSETTSSD